MTRNQTTERKALAQKVYDAVVISIMWSIPATVIVLSFLGIIR